MTAAKMTRREVIAGGLALGVGAVLVDPLALTAHADPQAETWSGTISQNGWPIIDRPDRQIVEGSRLSVALAPAAAVILVHCVRRFLYEIDDSVEADELVSHRSSRRIDASYESNHLSGTAVAIRPGWYPIGATGQLFDHQLVILRDILADCAGVVRWGGDEQVPKQSHLQIDVGPDDERLYAVTAKIRAWSVSPNRGAGAFVDPFSPNRRKRAIVVRDAQRR